jgi:hypothetical protein
MRYGFPSSFLTATRLATVVTALRPHIRKLPHCFGRLLFQMQCSRTLGVGILFSTVRATMAAASQPRARNSRTLRCVSVILALALTCGAAAG